MTSARIYDPCNVVKNALKNMRSYILPPTKYLWEEDIIAEKLDENVYREGMNKFRDVLSL